MYQNFQFSSQEVAILSQITSKTQTQIWLDFKLSELDKKQVKNFLQKQKKLEQNLPLDYILGQVKCGEIVLKIDKSVLIPRPETEFWLERLIQKWENQFANSQKLFKKNFNSQRDNSLKNLILPKIVEIGTGSGLIAITLANQFPQLEILATDICQKALNVAKKNAELNLKFQKVEFQKANLLNFKKEKLKTWENGWILIANLPYVPIQDLEICLENKVEFEPKKAIYSGKLGLDHFEKLLGELGKLAKISLESKSKKQTENATKNQIQNCQKKSKLPQDSTEKLQSKIGLPLEIYLELDPRNIRFAQIKLDKLCNDYLTKIQAQNCQSKENSQKENEENDGENWEKNSKSEILESEILETQKLKIWNLENGKNLEERKLSNCPNSYEKNPQKRIPKRWQSEIWLDESGLERLISGEFIY